MNTFLLLSILFLFRAEINFWSRFYVGYRSFSLTVQPSPVHDFCLYKNYLFILMLDEKEKSFYSFQQRVYACVSVYTCMSAQHNFRAIRSVLWFAGEVHVACKCPTASQNIKTSFSEKEIFRVWKTVFRSGVFQPEQCHKLCSACTGVLERFSCEPSRCIWNFN